jgi:proteic killer suppression protein
MIKSFKSKATQSVFDGEFAKKIPQQIQQRAREKLVMLHAAATFQDLKVPPSNQLEALKDDRAGQLAIRISKQYRICFRWEGGHAFDVEITDYH